MQFGPLASLATPVVFLIQFLIKTDTTPSSGCIGSPVVASYSNLNPNCFVCYCLIDRAEAKIDAESKASTLGREGGRLGL